MSSLTAGSLFNSVLEFKNPTTGKRYWHVIFKTGAKTYRYDDLKVLNKSKDEFSNCDFFKKNLQIVIF